jgi:hypothetical protein
MLDAARSKARRGKLRILVPIGYVWHREIGLGLGVLEQVVRLKGRIQAILHSNLIPKYSGHLFGKAGRIQP